MANLIIKSNIKGAVKEKIANVAGEVAEALNNKVQEVLDKACERAKANGRRTLHARDLWVKIKMDVEINKTIDILKKVFPRLIRNPEVMRGCDISQEEIDWIIENKGLSIEILENVAGDNFFEIYYKEVGLTLKEAKEVSLFLSKIAKYHVKDLKREFPYLKE